MSQTGGGISLNNGGGESHQIFPEELPGPTKIPWNFLGFPDCRASFNSSSPWSRDTHNENLIELPKKTWPYTPED